MKILISYSSLSGNTKYLAEGLHKTFKDQADIKSVDEDISVDDYEIILHGYWVNRGMPDSKSLKFLEALQNKKVGLFMTLGAYPDSDHAISSLENGANIVRAANEYIGGTITQGRISEAVKEKLRKMPKDHSHYPDKARIKRWADAENHPNEQDVQDVVEYFKNVTRS